MNDLDAIKSSQSASFKKRNPHIFTDDDLTAELSHRYQKDSDEIVKRTASKAKLKRIRQSDKPEMNRLESEWFHHIHHLGARPQAIKLKLARSVFYKPDFFSPTTMTAWEVKGLNGKNIDRGKLALKCAATAWPEIKFILVWKDEQGQWQEQHVLP